MELSGKIALVTGGGRGIGRAAALALAEAGADVAVLARTPGDVAATAAAIRAVGRRALALSADVTDAAAVVAAVARAGAELGAVGVLVNNAGTAPSLKFLDTTDALWQQTLQVNLTSAFAFSRAVLPGMLAAAWGRIINIASTAARVGYAYNAAYVASKHGLLGLTRALAMEVVKRGITVNAVCPGFTDTAIVDEAVQNLVSKTGRSAESARDTLADMSPQGRLMSAEEIARCVVYLSSEAARGINGQSIVIDGGGVQA